VSDDGDPTEAADADADRPGAPPRLCRVDGPVDAAATRPAVRLRREFKGLTVADLARDEIVDRLPGRVRSALHRIECGDLAGADAALPGEFAPIVAGPGSVRPAALRHWRWVLVVAVAVLTAALAWWWS
jgi:hypothetical protein